MAYVFRVHSRKFIENFWKGKTFFDIYKKHCVIHFRQSRVVKKHDCKGFRCLEHRRRLLPFLELHERESTVEEERKKFC